MNLLQETIGDIKQSGHSPEEIIFIGSEESGHSCTWAEFQKIADVEYDNGFGCQEVASDLVIVFSDGAKMWRHEYDGSEEWHYSRPFVMPAEQKPIARLIDGSMWSTLAEMHG